RSSSNPSRKNTSSASSATRADEVPVGVAIRTTAAAHIATAGPSPRVRVVVCMDRLSQEPPAPLDAGSIVGWGASARRCLAGRAIDPQSPKKPSPSGDGSSPAYLKGPDARLPAPCPRYGPVRGRNEASPEPPRKPPSPEMQARVVFLSVCHGK